MKGFFILPSSDLSQGLTYVMKPQKLTSFEKQLFSENTIAEFRE